MARICCNCGGSMEPEVVHGVTLDVCTKCGGAWLSGDELTTLLNSGPLGADDLKHLGQADVTQVKQGDSHMLCPDNHVPLQTYHYMYNSPLEIHTCPECGGLWVAAGEIEQMEAWRAQTNSPPTPKEAMAEDAGAMAAQEIASTSRWQNWGTFFNMINRWSPGWSGLL